MQNLRMKKKKELKGNCRERERGREGESRNEGKGDNNRNESKCRYFYVISILFVCNIPHLQDIPRKERERWGVVQVGVQSKKGGWGGTQPRGLDAREEMGCDEEG
jgi:hypothetical protein